MCKVASRLYDHQFYLTKEEAIEKDPLLKEYRGTIQRKPPKMARTSRLSLPEATKLLPHSTDDWKPYEYVLPSARTQTDFKQNLAIQHEQDAAKALYSSSAHVAFILFVQFQTMRMLG